ncbi:actin [Bulinus truncatus]|nr:actin [Bulinus truncatus]
MLTFILADRFYLKPYRTPAAFVAYQPMLTKHAIGLSRGLMVSVGDCNVHVVPIIDGYVLYHAIKRLDFGGRNLTTHLQKLIMNQGYSFTTAHELEIVRELKEKFLLHTRKKKSEDTGLNTSCQLSDGSFIELDSRTFKSPEILFQSDGVVHNGKSIVGTLYLNLYLMLILITELTCIIQYVYQEAQLFPGFAERLKNEMLTVLSNTKPRVKIWVFPKRRLHKWIEVMFETLQDTSIFLGLSASPESLRVFKQEGIVVTIGDQGHTRELKECLCFVARDRYHLKQLISATESKCAAVHTFTDGTKVRLDSERYLCPEILFDSDSDLHQMGLILPWMKNVTCVQKYYSKPDGTFHRGRGLVDNNSGYNKLLRHREQKRHVSHDNSLEVQLYFQDFPFSERVKSALNSYPNVPFRPRKIWAVPERAYQTWIGGSILASMSSFTESG